MKRYSSNLIFKLALFFASVFSPPQVFSAGLVPDCGGGAFVCNFCDLVMLFDNVINFFIYLSIPIAVILFVWIGWDLIVQGNKSSAITTARSRFVSLLTGLFFLLSSWLLVTLITSSLVGGNFTDILTGNYTCISTPMVPAPLPPGPPGPPGPLPPVAPPVALSAAEALLAENNITTKSSGNCSDKTNPTCTSLDGIQPNTLAGTINLADQCRLTAPCVVVITGGTEIGHSMAHSAGKKIDISKNDANFNAFIGTITAGIPGVHIAAGIKYSNVVSGGMTYIIIDESDHWDIQVI